MLLLLALLAASVGTVAAVYLLYFFVVLLADKKEFTETLNRAVQSPTSRTDLPRVTILMPAYNEEDAMLAKMKNISEFDYPLDKIEVLVLDDNSTDKTREIAEGTFKTFNLKGKIIRGKSRQGVNALYNSGFENVTSELVLTTDVDAIMLPDTLLKGVKILLALKDVGGIAAKMTPTHSETTASTRTAGAYTDWYYAMLEAESAICSTFPGGSSCMLVRKSAVNSISASYGSSDGNISLAIIKKGFRFILAPNVQFLEPVSQRFGEMRRQKIRRATRLIQATMLHKDIFLSGKYRQFGKVIFPLRLLMMTIVPILALLSICLLFACVCLVSYVLFGVLLAGAIAILVLGTRTNVRMLNTIVSFLTHQIYLFAGILFIFRKMPVWSHIERTPSES